MENSLTVSQPAPAEMTVQDVERQIGKIQELMAAVMKKDEHYGVIPGTGKKPSLLKPGAEKINFIFRLEPEYEILRHELPGGHREFEIKCTLRQIGSGAKVGEGVGSCSTMETKYRYRNEEVKEDIGAVPKAYWDAPREDPKARDTVLSQMFGPGKYRCKKVENAWRVFKITGDGEKKDNPDIADVYNTVLKMAKKRAYVDATLTATAASDFFTQDVEDFAEPGKEESAKQESAPPRQEAPAKKAEGQSTTIIPNAAQKPRSDGSMFDDRPIEH